MASHVAAATPHLTYDCDTHYPQQSVEDEIVEGGRIPIVDGFVEVTDKPGLGVTLDHDQLARGRERYENAPTGSGTTHRDAKVRRSQWERILPRW